MTGRPRVWPVVVTAAAGIAILCALGAWQVERLGQKQALLAAIAARQDAAPVPLSEAMDRQARGEDVEFLKVTAAGRYLPGAEKRLIATFNGSPAWEIVAPLVTADRHLVLVDRGPVPDDGKDYSPPATDVAVTGIARRHAAGKGFFSPDNDVKSNRWFWWDVPAMLATTAVPPGAAPANFVLHELPQAGATGFPRSQAPDAGISNNHLQYALTWFGLALVLAAVAGVYIRGQMKNPGP